MKISIVIPVFNEVENIGSLYEEISEVMKSVSGEHEIVLINDGSTDGTDAVLDGLAKADPSCRVVKLLSNYGQSTATSAGCDIATGDIIITLDGDGQHDPADIPKFLEKIDEGFHVVCGWRTNRTESDPFLSKVLPSRIFNFLTTRMSGLHLHDIAGGMRAFRRDVLDYIDIYGEMHRYLAVLAAWKGFRVTEVPIELRRRKSGSQKYGIWRLFRGFIDLITVKYFISYSTRPLHVFGAIGLLLAGGGLFIGAYLAVRRLFLGVSLVENHFPLLILFALLVIVSVNFFFMGLIADMISADAISSSKRKLYVIEKISD